MKIALLTNHPRLVDPAFITALGRWGPVTASADVKALSPQALADVLKHSDVAITGWGTPVLPDPQPDWKLRYVCHITGELRGALSRAYFTGAIPVTNWGTSFTFATAEASIALLLATLKGLPALDAKIRRDGTAPDWPHFWGSIHQKRVGIYGLSPIGKLVAQQLRAFGPEISYYDPVATDIPEGLIRRASLHELFANADVVMIHAGLNEHTRATVNAELIRLLPHGGILINTARGAIVVEKDLAAILQEGKLRAGIDVCEDEHDFRTSPLMACPNTVMTGHALSCIGEQERSTLQATVLDNLGRFQRGEPLQHVVSLARYGLMS